MVMSTQSFQYRLTRRVKRDAIREFHYSPERAGREGVESG